MFMPQTEREHVLILPKFDNDGHRIEVDMLRKYATMMAKEFDGVSIAPTTLGCWVPKGGELQCEENIKLSSSRDLDDMSDAEAETRMRKDRQFMDKLAKAAGDEFGQDAIFVQTDIIKDFDLKAGRWVRELPEALRETDVFQKLFI